MTGEPVVQDAWSALDDALARAQPELDVWSPLARTVVLSERPVAFHTESVDGVVPAPP